MEKTNIQNTEAKHLRIRVSRNGKTSADLSFPSRAARWIIDMIPDDVITKIQEKGISISEIQASFNAQDVLVPQNIFELNTPEKNVKVWLE